MEKLSKLIQELKAPKNQRNTFGGYNYRSAEDILEAVKPLLDGAILTISDEIVLIGDRFYVKATATYRNGNFTQSATAYAREPLAKKGMDESQITGAASSYARKYSLNGLLCIDDTKDADATNTHGKESTAELVSDAQIKLLTDLGCDIPKLVAFYKVGSIDQLTSEQAEQAIKAKLKKNKDA